jgi:RNA polymerase sigma-70 factor (ECF subfamily)
MPLPKVDDPRWSTSNLSRWFAEEVHPHENSLRAYLRGSFPAVRDVDDVVQESFLRAWRARAGQPVRSAKAFLFRIARNLALDLVRRDHASPVQRVRDLEAIAVLDHDCSPVQAAVVQEKLMMLADAIEALPPRCREVLILRKLQNLPQRAVAEQLGLTEKTVEAQLARGIARCEAYLRRRGVRGWYDHD